MNENVHFFLHDHLAQHQKVLHSGATQLLQLSKGRIILGLRMIWVVVVDNNYLLFTMSYKLASAFCKLTLELCVKVYRDGRVLPNVYTCASCCFDLDGFAT